jgi:hypothetical protein
MTSNTFFEINIYEKFLEEIQIKNKGKLNTEKGDKLFIS